MTKSSLRTQGKRPARAPRLQAKKTPEQRAVTGLLPEPPARPKVSPTRGKPVAPAFRRGREAHEPGTPKRKAERSLAAVSRNPARPFWVPEGTDLDFVPEEVQQAVAELIEPVYQQFVVGATGGLEKSLGVTITHLLWLEILEQFDLKREYTQVQSVLGVAGNRQSSIAQHLRLIDSKLRVGYFLVRLQDLRRRQAEQTEVARPLLDPESLLPDPLGRAVIPHDAPDSA